MKLKCFVFLIFFLLYAGALATFCVKMFKCNFSNSGLFVDNVNSTFFLVSRRGDILLWFGFDQMSFHEKNVLYIILLTFKHLFTQV